MRERVRAVRVSTEWTARQLLAATRQHGLGLESPRYNPRPPGVIRLGSATEATLLFLRDAAPRWLAFHQIQAGTGRSRVAVSWALLYLRSQQLVECVGDAARNPRYLRYRAIAEAPPSARRK